MSVWFWDEKDRCLQRSTVLVGEIFGCPSSLKPNLLQLAMSAQEIPETQPDETLFPCLKCGLDCSAKDGALLRGTAWQCKACTNVYQILYRHMGGFPDSWSQMTPQSQMEFFKHAGGAIKCAPKNGRWSHVRSSLVSQMTHFHTEQRRIRCTREYLPLSVWATRGFDTKKIECKGEKRTDEALQIFACHIWGKQFISCFNCVLKTDFAPERNIVFRCSVKSGRHRCRR